MTWDTYEEEDEMKTLNDLKSSQTIDSRRRIILAGVNDRAYQYLIDFQLIGQN